MNLTTVEESMLCPVYSFCHLWHLTIFFEIWISWTMTRAYLCQIYLSVVYLVTNQIHILRFKDLGLQCSYKGQWPMLFNHTTHEKKKPPRLRKHCLIIIANKPFFMLTLVRCTTFANKLLLTKIATIVYPSKAQKNTAFIFQH